MKKILEFPKPVPSELAGYELTQEQARRLKEQIWPMLSYMTKLLSRLEARSPDYPELRTIVSKNQEALQHICMHLHYEEIGDGRNPLRGRPRE